MKETNKTIKIDEDNWKWLLELKLEHMDKSVNDAITRLREEDQKEGYVYS